MLLRSRLLIFASRLLTMTTSARAPGHRRPHGLKSATLFAMRLSLGFVTLAEATLMQSGRRGSMCALNRSVKVGLELHKLSTTSTTPRTRKARRRRKRNEELAAVATN